MKNNNSTIRFLKIFIIIAAAGQIAGCSIISPQIVSYQPVEKTVITKICGVPVIFNDYYYSETDKKLSLQPNYVENICGIELDKTGLAIYGDKYININETADILNTAGISGGDLAKMTSTRLALAANRSELNKLSDNLKSQFILIAKPSAEIIPKYEDINWSNTYMKTTALIDTKSNVIIQIIDLKQAIVIFEEYYSSGDEEPDKSFFADAFNNFTTSYIKSYKTGSNKTSLLDNIKYYEKNNKTGGKN